MSYGAMTPSNGDEALSSGLRRRHQPGIRAGVRDVTQLMGTSLPAGAVPGIAAASYHAAILILYRQSYLEDPRGKGARPSPGTCYNRAVPSLISFAHSISNWRIAEAVYR
jgi:hypothetical protein